MSEVQLVYDRRQTTAQVLTVLAVSFGPFAVGLGKGYSSPALASLAQPRSLSGGHHLEVSPQQTSWLASLSLLGALLGGLLSSVVLRCGRRNSLLAVSLPFSASWMLTVFATSVEMLLATAFLAGVCSAIVIVVSQVSHITHDSGGASHMMVCRSTSARSRVRTSEADCPRVSRSSHTRGC